MPDSEAYKGTVCTVCKKMEHSDQMINLIEKLTDFKYELSMVYLDRDIQFLSYALFGNYRSMITYE